MSARVYLFSTALALSAIVTGAKICEWQTAVKRLKMPDVLSTPNATEQIENLESDAHSARQDLNVGKYYVAVQSAIGVGFLAFMLHSGNAYAMSLVTTGVAVIPGYMFAKIKIDDAVDRLDAVKRAQNSIIIMETPRRLKKV